MGAMTALAVGSMAVGLGSNIANISRGRRTARQAERDLDNYQRQDLTNAYTGMTVPTRGATMQRRETQRTQAETAYMAGQMGARGLSAAPRIASSTQQSMERIGAQIEESENRLQQMIAQDEARIRQMQEGREQQDIAGLGAQLAYGQSQEQAGWSGITSTMASGANLAMNMPQGGDVTAQGQGGQPLSVRPQVQQPQPWQNRVGGNYQFEGYTPNPRYQNF